MTHNLALRGLRHAAHHVCPARVDTRLISLSLGRQITHWLDLKHIRNTSTTSATIDHENSSQVSKWGSLAHRAGPIPHTLAEPERLEEGKLSAKPSPTTTTQSEIGPNTKEETDVERDEEGGPTKSIAPPEKSLTRPHDEKSSEDIIHKHTESASARSSLQPNPIGHEYRRKRLTQDFPSGTADNEVVRALYELLRREAGFGRIQKVEAIVEQLVRDHGEAPNSRLYSAMILVNHDPEFGSAAEAERVLMEMRDEGIEPTEACYHNVLKVLAVHTDCLLRDQIVDEMRERWVRISHHGMHDIIAGQIREGQMEQALELFDSERGLKRSAPRWLKDMFIYHLCNLGELDQALKMVKDRVAMGETNISPSMWYYFFDHACSDLHSESLQYIWRQRVEHKHLNPSSGQCLQALIASAHTGDVQVATDIFRILSQRGTSFKPYHYELLIAAQVRAGDMRTALTVVCIMHAVNMKPKMASLAPFTLYLQEDPARAAEAFTILKELKEERQVPTVAVNCILASLVKHNKHEDVITTYKSLHRICKQGPTVDTFNTIFRSCHRNNDKKTAMFFAAEMVELKIRPDSLTYDRLILTCIREKDYEDAFRYYKEMMHSGYQPRLGTWSLMVQVCCNARDKRAFELVQKMEELGFKTSRSVQYLQENWPEKADEIFGLHSSTLDT